MKRLGLIASLLVVLFAGAATAEDVKIDLQSWQSKAYAAGLDDNPIGGRLGVSGDFSAFGRSFNGGARLDVIALNGEAVDFGNIATLGNFAAFRAQATTDVGGNLAIGAFGGFATALDQDVTAANKFPKEFGVFVQFTDKASGSTFQVGVCRSEATRATLGAGQICFSGEVPVGPVRFGGDAYLDAKSDSQGRDLMRLRVGVSVPELVKAIF